MKVTTHISSIFHVIMLYPEKLWKSFMLLNNMHTHEYFADEETNEYVSQEMISGYPEPLSGEAIAPVLLRIWWSVFELISFTIPFNPTYSNES